MKTTITLLTLLVLLSSGCQVIDLEQENMWQDVQMSNTNWEQGYPFYAKKKAWYILDLGPLNDASLSGTINHKIPANSNLHSTVITTKYTAFDTILRLLTLDPLYTWTPIVGSRTIIVEGQMNY